MKEIRLITAALPYINNIPHLGHIVGSHLPADIFARFCRAKGYETLFIGGTDEHGSASEIAASSIGVDIEEFGKKLHQEHKKIYDWFNISYDNFSRTPSKNHYEITQEFFEKIYENGYIKEGKMKVFYSPKDNRFLPDRYIVGTCPKCGYEDANGEQCEKCTSVLDPYQLINPKSILSGEKLELKETNHLFLRLDKLSSPLEKWIKKQKNWRQQVKSIALGWIKEGLKERCITRDLKHGVPIPLKGFEDKVFYVWFDAPIGYISFARETKQGKNDRFWKEKNAKVYHFLGKDNIPFHTIFWPGMLIANGEFNLPYQVVGLQYLNYEGGKFSKSKRRGVFCEKLLETGISPDIMRSYLIFLIPETNDSEFKWDEFQRRINSDIIGNFGNLVNRTISFIYDRLDRKIEKPKEKEIAKIDKKFYEEIRKKTKRVSEYLESVRLKEAFSEILSLSNDGNKYFEETKPWEVIKSDRKRAKHILYNCASLCRTLAILSYPFIPSTSESIWAQLNLDGRVDEPKLWDSASEIKIPDIHKVSPPKILFEKISNEYLTKFKDSVSNSIDISKFFR